MYSFQAVHYNVPSGNPGRMPHTAGNAQYFSVKQFLSIL